MALEYFHGRITGGWIGKRKIIYVWDWSVSGDPIISWDVNYTVLSLHVKRQIIEEGKRCATLYLCSHSLVDMLFLVCPFSSSFSSPFLCPQRIYWWITSHFHSWSFFRVSISSHQSDGCSAQSLHPHRAFTNPQMTSKYVNKWNWFNGCKMTMNCK